MATALRSAHSALPRVVVRSLSTGPPPRRAPSSASAAASASGPAPSAVRPEVASFVDKLRARRVPGAAALDADALTVRAWVQAPRAQLVARVNAAFSLAAFPVHAYGFWLGLSPTLLAWPALFSVCWLGYSIMRARRTVTALELVPGPRARFFTRSFFGTEREQLQVALSAVRVLPQTERQRKSGVCYLDVYVDSKAFKAQKQRLDALAATLSTLTQRANDAHNALENAKGAAKAVAGQPQQHASEQAVKDAAQVLAQVRRERDELLATMGAVREEKGPIRQAATEKERYVLEVHSGTVLDASAFGRIVH